MRKLNLFFNSQVKACMEVAKRVAEQSKDPRTKVGAVIVNTKKEIISTGYNCMPMGQDTKFPWLKRNKAHPNDTYGIASEHKHFYGIQIFFF